MVKEEVLELKIVDLFLFIFSLLFKGSPIFLLGFFYFFLFFLFLIFKN